MGETYGLELAWDYSAEPFWVDGVNTPATEIVKDRKALKAIAEWYAKFSAAEEAIHASDAGGRLDARKCRKALVEMRDMLIPEGRRLAKVTGAKFVVDYGHDPALTGLEFEVFGRRKLGPYWKRQGTKPPKDA